VIAAEKEQGSRCGRAGQALW